MNYDIHTSNDDDDDDNDATTTFLVLISLIVQWNLKVIFFCIYLHHCFIKNSHPSPENPMHLLAS